MKFIHKITIILSLTLAVACSNASNNQPNNANPVGAAEISQKDIVDTAIDAGIFTTLVAAVQAAGLVDTLKSEGPFTVFAPTDEAFNKLPEGTVETLLKPENIETLKSILLYHVNVGNKLKAEQVVKLTEVESATGELLAISIIDGKVFINESEVIITDIVTSNGIIHVIDAVLLP